MMMIIIIND